MTRTGKTLVGIILIIAAAILFAIKNNAFSFLKQKPEVLAAGESCYWSQTKGESGYADVEWMRLSLDGTTVTKGEFALHPAEKDSKTGSFSGTLDGSTLKLSWETMGEGMTAREQLWTLVNPESVTPLFGEMIADTNAADSYVYKDVTSLSPQMEIPKVSCESLDSNIAAFNAGKGNIANEVAAPVVNGEKPTTPENAPANAKPARGDLEQSSWVFNSVKGASLAIKSPNVFTLKFDTSRVSIGTDCNSAGAEYSAKEGKISFGGMVSTLMYCEGSQESEYLRILGEASTFTQTAKNLVITTKSGAKITYDRK